MLHWDSINCGFTGCLHISIAFAFLENFIQCYITMILIIFIESMRNLFSVTFVAEHSNERRREESTYMFFLKYLEDSEEDTGSDHYGY